MYEELYQQKERAKMLGGKERRKKQRAEFRERDKFQPPIDYQGARHISYTEYT